MRHIFLLFCFLSVVSLNAQRGGGGGSSQRGQGGGPPQAGANMQNRTPVKFDAAKASGMVYYDAKKVIKKLKIKGNNQLKFDIEKAISNYNHKLDEISLVNKRNFDTLNLYMNDILKSLQAGGDRSKMQVIRSSVREKLRPVIRSVKQEESKLNKSMALMLDEKQLHKWKKYQKETKAELMPEKGYRQMRNDSGGSQNRQGGGQRMQGGGAGGGR